MHRDARTRPNTRLTRAVRVILAHTTPVTAALQCETRTIPIVFVNVSDPVGAGFIESLARPGGNLTGLLQHEAGIFGKWLAMPKEIAPRVARVALLANPNVPAMNTSCAPQKPQRRRWRSRFCAARSRTQPTFPHSRFVPTGDIGPAVAELPRPHRSADSCIAAKGILIQSPRRHA
jgi:hypothetical protein